MSEIILFDYEDSQVRTVLVDDEPWFVATDVAKILEFRSAPDMTRSLDDDEKGYADVRTPGGTQTLTIITEAGLYQAIFGSRGRSVNKFKRWVAHEVLPQIRKSGSYSVQPQVPQDYLSALRELVASVEVNQQLESKIAEDAPKVEAFEAFLDSSGTFEVADVAKMLAHSGVDTGRQRLFSQLERFGWVYRAGDGKWRARQQVVSQGLLEHKPQWHYHPKSGERVMDAPQVRVTAKGLESLRRKFASLQELVMVT